MKAKFQIIESQAGARLDKFLVEQLPDYSRSQIQKTIKGGGVIVNDKTVKKPHHFLKAGDAVAVSVIASETKPAYGWSAGGRQSRESVGKVAGSPRSASSSARDDIKVIAEEPDYIIIEKPSGLLVHPTEEKNLQSEICNLKSLTDWIRERYPECASVGDNPEIRPGIVHRLDKDASGLMVIARTQKMFEHLKQQFQNHLIHKEYKVLAHGIMQDDFETIDFPIARSEQHARMAARPKNSPPLEGGVRGGIGKEAITEYEVIQRYTNATLVKVTPKTGRTHQIRVHFFAIKHAIIGDPLYWHKKQNRKLDEACGRLFLHATRLQFRDLHDGMVEYKSDLPEELQNFLYELKPKP